ncbi:EamA family transporter, partial [Acinetobacter baumannii]
MSPRKQGYFFVLVTMCIWGGFTLFARLNAQWHISAWDIAALRFAIAFLILMPILIYKKDLAFLWSKHAVILALIGGVIYCLTVYTALLY